MFFVPFRKIILEGACFCRRSSAAMRTTVSALPLFAHSNHTIDLRKTGRLYGNFLLGASVFFDILCMQSVFSSLSPKGLLFLRGRRDDGPTRNEKSKGFFGRHIDRNDGLFGSKKQIARSGVRCCWDEDTQIECFHVLF